MSHWTRIPAAVAVGAMALALGSCTVGNAGGETTCGEFQRFTADQQKAVVEKMLTDEGESTAQAAGYRQSIVAMCLVMGDPNVKIKRVSTG